MAQRIFCIILILLVSHLPIMESASAQIVPAINLECQSVHPSGNLELYVSNNSSGNVSDYAECTVSNPNLYQEKIRILVFSNGLKQESPADFYVEANSEVDFQVKIILDATRGWGNQTREITIIAEVLEANGVPPPLYTSSESELLVDIIVYEEAQETETVISEKSDDDQSLIYAVSGGAVLLLLILLVVIRRKGHGLEKQVSKISILESSLKP